MPLPSVPPPGYEWRPAGLDDAPALVDLFTAVDAAEGLDELLGPEATRRELTFPGIELGRDTLLGLTPYGTAAAFAWVWSQPTPAAARAIVWVEAHPDHLHLEPFLFAWAEASARPLLAGGDPGVRRYLRQHVEEHRSRRCRALEEAGYRHARTFVEMRRPLGDGLARPAPPLDARIVAWSPDLEEGARLAANEAFALHWDSLPVGPEDWHQRVSEDPTFLPGLSRLAVRAGRVVGLCLAAADPEHNRRIGVEELWVERVGTVPGCQRQGLATALVGEVLRGGAAAGFTRAALGVDQDSTTRATSLYERLGFTAVHRTLAYTKDLD